MIKYVLYENPVILFISNIFDMLKNINNTTIIYITFIPDLKCLTWTHR